MTEEIEVQETEQPKINEFINADGTFKEGFHNALPDDLGKHSWVQKYKTVTDLIKGAVSLNSVVGQKTEDLINSDKAEIQEKIRSIRGIPSSVTEYEYELPESFNSLPDDLKSKMIEYADSQKEVAIKELSLTKDQFAKLMSREMDQAAQEFKARQNEMETYRQTATQELMKKWGRDHSDNLKRTMDTCVHIGRPEWAERAQHDPEFAAQLHESIVPFFEDDKIIEFKQKKDLLTTEEEFAYNNEQMLNFTGDLQSVEYKKMVEKNRKYLEKMN